jgi:hypothetical protein
MVDLQEIRKWPNVADEISLFEAPLFPPMLKMNP